ncbi:MAG: hypothetical protein H0Z29_10060 [Candidatus Marinimicrobia bacterium]|nr:hypothetical protein [Candidatus Neomarinimicrobiota bacterium]
MEGVNIEVLISVLIVAITGSAVGYLHKLLEVKNFKTRILVVLFAGIFISFSLVLPIKLLDLLSALYMYYCLLANIIGISIVIFFDKIVFRLRFSSILFGILNFLILIFISKIKMKDIEVGYLYLLLIGISFFLGFQLKNLKK